MADLVNAFTNRSDAKVTWDQFTADAGNDYVKRLQQIIETLLHKKAQRNFLNHLLAHFGEAFADYTVQMYEEQCTCTETQEGVQVNEKTER